MPTTPARTHVVTDDQRFARLAPPSRGTRWTINGGATPFRVRFAVHPTKPNQVRIFETESKARANVLFVTLLTDSLDAMPDKGALFELLRYTNPAQVSTQTAGLSRLCWALTQTPQGFEVTLTCSRHSGDSNRRERLTVPTHPDTPALLTPGISRKQVRQLADGYLLRAQQRTFELATAEHLAELAATRNSR